MNSKENKINWLALLLQIVVVFIGVTMGFFLNNWSANQNDLELERKYKTALIQDIDIHVSVLNNFLFEDSIWVNRTQNIINKSEKNPSVALDSLQTIFNLITSANLLLSQKSTFQSLENSGEINLISNFELKVEINKFFGVSLLQVELREKQYFDFVQNSVTPFAFKTYNSEKEKFLSPQKDAIQYMNFLLYALKRKKQLIGTYQNLMGHSLYLKDKIEKSLNN